MCWDCVCADACCALGTRHSVGIATMILVTGVPAFSQQALLHRLTALGIDRLKAQPLVPQGQEQIKLPPRWPPASGPSRPPAQSPTPTSPCASPIPQTRSRPNAPSKAPLRRCSCRWPASRSQGAGWMWPTPCTFRSSSGAVRSACGGAWAPAADNPGAVPHRVGGVVAAGRVRRRRRRGAVHRGLRRAAGLASRHPSRHAQPGRHRLLRGRRLKRGSTRNAQ